MRMYTVSCSGLSIFQSEQEISVRLMGKVNSTDLWPENTLAGSVAILIRVNPDPFPHLVLI
jgi:hypothetical protein